MKLGFDIDEVVADLTSVMENYIRNNYGVEWPKECFLNYGFDKCRFDSNEELNNKITKDMLTLVDDANFQADAEPVSGAVEVLQKLKRSGHKVFLISSRPKQNQPKTFRWLRKYDIPFDELALVGHGVEKGALGRKFNLDMYVDALPKHLESMYKLKKTWRKSLLLFDRPWNTGPIDTFKFKRVYDWQEILRHVGIQNR